MKLKRLSLTLLTFCISIVCGTKVAEAATVTVVARGLDNPLGLNFGPDGALYVAEAGRGGTGPCIPWIVDQSASLCYGPTGAVTRIQNGTHKRVLTGLPSLALSDGSTGIQGPQDIKFDSTGNPYVAIGYAGDPSLRSTVLKVPEFAQLLVADFKTNSRTSVADLGSYELINNPDQVELNSNPYHFLIKDNTAFVVDAGANALLSVGLDGSNLALTSLFSSRTLVNPVFPPSTSESPSEVAIESVPTSVVIGPDGAKYVSELTGFPHPEGEARIYRIGADNQPAVYVDGFTELVDLDFDSQGSLYALEYSAESSWKNNQNGALIQIAPDGTRTNIITGNGLFHPTALAIGSDGAFYVTNQGDRPGEGQVIRIENTKPVPEPTSALGVLAFGALGLGSLLKGKRHGKRI